MILVQLGRAGDIINVLPLAFALSKKLGRIRWLVGEQHASILEGASYVDPIIWAGGQDTLPQALSRYRGANPICTQAWLNPDPRRLTDSFAKEQWRYSGHLNERDSWPLIFDQQDIPRANALRDSVLSQTRKLPPFQNKPLSGGVESRHADRNAKPDSYPDAGGAMIRTLARGPSGSSAPPAQTFQNNKPTNNAERPIVLCATESVSTPYRYTDKLIATIRGLDADVIDMRDVRAHRIYDLLALYEAADCLVSVDTVHLHLAKASNCPTIALINDGWRGCVPPPQAVASWRYSELGNDLSPVLRATRRQLARKADSIAVVISTYKPDTDRHRRAMATHPLDAIYSPCDHRPKVKDFLLEGLRTGKDVVAFTNDDVSFPIGALDRIKRHARQWNFGCSRRPRNPVHVGREIFWFRSDWLKANWTRVPECIWSVQKPDLILAKWMRGIRGIRTTMENLQYDFAPVELPGIIEHEDHPSDWDRPEVIHSVEGRHNEALWSAMT